MNETSRDALRRSLLLGYDDLKSRLTRQLGSAELAGDALQETYLQLHRGAELAPVRKPVPYLLRMALRIALRSVRGEKRTVSLDDAKIAMGIPDALPDPYRAAAARAELDALQRAVAELTPRRRVILHAARIEGLALRAIAERLDISQRLVEMELRQALAHCALRLDRKVVQRFGPRPRHDSKGQGALDDED
jgi:RNA polymerase sigma factor (sigma-70 family)